MQGLKPGLPHFLNDSGDIELGIQLIRKHFIWNSKSTVWSGIGIARRVALNLGSSCEIGKTVSLCLFGNCHRSPIWASTTKVLGLGNDNGSIGTAGIFHVISKLVATALETQRATTGQTNMEHEIITILRRFKHVIPHVFWENRWPEMQARNETLDGLIGGRDLEGGDVDGAGNKKLFVKWWR